MSEAKKILQNSLNVLNDIQMVSLSDAIQHVLATDITAPMDVPQFDNSAMDGYAFHWSENATSFEIGQIIKAGERSEETIPHGYTARIFTGAPMPKGTDTVVPQELVQRQGSRIVLPAEGVKKKSNVRYKGEQCKTGETILRAGTIIQPGHIGLLASLGISRVPVRIQPKIEVLITGSELVAIGAPLPEGKIYNSNGPMIEAILRKNGFTASKYQTASDQNDEITQKIENAMAQSDVLLISGGISVGEYDFVKEALTKLGVVELFHKVRQKPGKPFYAGKKETTWVFGLPGNPYSVFACMLQYVVPVLQGICGAAHPFQNPILLPLCHSYSKKSGLTHFLKGICSPEGVQITSGQDSFNLLPLSEANCLVALDEEETEFRRNDLVAVYLI